MTAAQALLFDLYETLVEPEWQTLRAGREALARAAGVEPGVLLPHWQRTHEGRMRGTWGGLEGDLTQILSGWQTDVQADLVRALVEMEMGNWARGVRPYPEVLDQLARLRAAGYQLAIVSNASHEAASVIEGLGLDRLVDAVVVSCRMGALKPEPAIFQAALDQLGVAPERALLVDDVAANLDGGAVLGVRGALMNRTGKPLEEAPRYPVIRSLVDLWPLLEGQGKSALPRRAER